MVEPKIVYGIVEQGIHTNGQYLLMEADISNGVYKTSEFIEMVNSVSLDGIAIEKNKSDVNVLRGFMVNLASTMGETVTIKNFYPDREALETFVNITTFEGMYKELHRGH